MDKNNLIDDNFIQNIYIEEIKTVKEVIKRIATNSFLIKGWTITLIVVTLLLKDAEKIQFLIALIPLFLFWFLDSYFLRQDQLYRKLHNWVVNNRLSSKEFIFDLDIGRFKKEIGSIYKVMFSSTIFRFYFALLFIFGLLYFSF